MEQNVQFVYPNNIEDFNYLIDSFMSEKSQLTPENNLEELTQIDKLIIMDDVSGLADKSEEFSNVFYCFSKIWIFLCLCFSYYLSWSTELGNDHGSNMFLIFFMAQSTVGEY